MNHELTAVLNGRAIGRVVRDSSGPLDLYI